MKFLLILMICELVYIIVAHEASICDSGRKHSLRVNEKRESVLLDNFTQNARNFSFIYLVQLHEKYGGSVHLFSTRTLT